MYVQVNLSTKLCLPQKNLQEPKILVFKPKCSNFNLLQVVESQMKGDDLSEDHTNDEEMDVRGLTLHRRLTSVH